MGSKNPPYKTENLNAGNSKANLGGVDQAISNIAADAVSQYYYDEQLKDMGYAMDAAAKSEHAAYRLEQAKRLNLETLATDTGEQFRQSGIGLKPYVSGASLSNWDVAADKAAAAQQKRTADAIGMIGMAPVALGGLGIAATPILGAKTAILTGMTVNGGLNAGIQQYKYGEIKYPGELAINVGFGALEGYFGIFGGIGWNATVGAASNIGSALTAGKYYQYDKDHQVDTKTLLTTGVVGLAFGGGAKAIEEPKLAIELYKNSKESLKNTSESIKELLRKNNGNQ